MNRVTEMNLTPERLIYYHSLLDCKFVYLICVNQKLIYHQNKQPTKQNCYYNTSASLCQIIQLCQELPIYWHFVVVNGGLPSSYFTLLFYYCWLRLCSTPLLNGRCWNKLKYPFYPCQKCIHEEHWLFNAGQMWWFLWKYVFCVEGKWKLRLGCSSTHFWRWRGWGLCICVAFMPMFMA